MGGQGDTKGQYTRNIGQNMFETVISFTSLCVLIKKIMCLEQKSLRNLKLWTIPFPIGPKVMWRPK